ncbi:hypothetical protein SO802_006587 [Lithocarpus litseifolius]|uniref:chorismate synthase n=1 Tax=Lithocarpus litseifolius TaxID=425828 RepID=A0AAW2DMY8_9ROSI
MQNHNLFALRLETYDMKYGARAVQGGGRSSARETIGRVAAGAVAKKILKTLAGTEVKQKRGVEAVEKEFRPLSAEEREKFEIKSLVNVT